MNNTIMFYDAFISYRHVEPDQTIAKRLFSLLENYQTPKALSSKGLPGKLTRVFLDEEELPTSTNLSESIKEALEKSKFLIVLCSEETPKSRYVAQEIEIFKALGREDNILAVLIGEDASKCFPKELYSVKDLTVVNRDQEKKLTVDSEPLAANIHAASIVKMLRKLEKKEKLRLLAPMLGCSFDDLYGRERKRNRKRILLSVLSIAAAAMLVCALLFINHVNQKQSAQSNLFNEIDQNLKNLDTIVGSMKVIFDDQTLNDKLEQQRSGVIGGDINTLLHYNYLATIVQGQIDSLDSLFREEQFADENIEHTKNSERFFENGHEIDRFYEGISNVEEEGYDLIGDCKSLQDALRSENEEAARIYSESLHVNLNMYYKHCESVLISGILAAQSTGASTERLNELISVFNDTLQFEPITDPSQLSKWMNDLTDEMATLLEQQSKVNDELATYVEHLRDSYSGKVNETVTITESDSMEDVRGKILTLASFGRLEEVQAGLDYFERRFVTEENPTDQVYVDSARRFMPLYINDEINFNGGVCILSITQGAPFETAGFVAGDVILRYNGIETVTSDDLINAQKEAKQKMDQVEAQYIHFNEDGSYEMITKSITSEGMGAWLCSM